jgi:hypothetical protein
MDTNILASVEISRQLATALLSIRRGDTTTLHHEVLVSCRDHIAKQINPDPNERGAILRALATAEQSLSDYDLKRLASGESAIEFIQPKGESFRAQLINALPIDRIIIENLILGAAPERAAKLQEIWRKHNPEFVVVPDSRGFTLKARDSDRRIIYDLKTLRMFPLLAHAAWRVFVCHVPHVLTSFWTGRPIDGQMMWNDENFPGVRAAFEAFLDVAQNAVNAPTADDISWPKDLCDVTADPSTLTTEQRAIRDLSLMALAYAFLHEIRHVMFRDPSEPRLDDAAEELACDAFARDFLLEQVGDYAEKSCEPINAILAKRAAAISVGAFAVYEVTAPEQRRGSSAYPPFADRFETLITGVAIPTESYLWVFAATLLLAILRRQNFTAALSAKTPDELCRIMIDAIRDQVRR